ncbi:MAG TPA: Ger(x)C family spore germination C-terminal domain-containing protein, partial [Bacillota bacterium]|nr:Ger(x)C family spore germination C-terminal domain-containing protein [Bacillota bacterium]
TPDIKQMVKMAREILRKEYFRAGMGISGAKMVGELDGEETTSFLMVNGQYKHSYITFPDPLNQDYFLIADVRQSRPPSHKAQMVNGKPRITVKIMLEADYLSIQSGINYEELSKTGIFERSAEKLLDARITGFLQRTAQLESDICGFGYHQVGKFLVWRDWEAFNWLSRYKDATFDVDVDFKIRRPGLKLKSVPFRGGGGE